MALLRRAAQPLRGQPRVHHRRLQDPLRPSRPRPPLIAPPHLPPRQIQQDRRLAPLRIAHQPAGARPRPRPMAPATSDSLHTMLSGCTVLESLSLDRIIGIGRLCISSPTLQTFSFSAGWNEQGIITFHELIMEDVPCLERLTHSDNDPSTIRIIRAPKLQILGLFSHEISALHSGNIVFQKMATISLTTKIHTMKILVLDSIGPNLDAVIQLLKCFPCLEKLYVIFHPQEDMNNRRKHDSPETIECLELRLEKVVLKNYDGDKRPAVDFAKFLILNAKVLKEMEIRVVNRRNDKWMQYQRSKRLRVENRASQDARIELIRDRNKTFNHRDHPHDFSVAGLFDRS